MLATYQKLSYKNVSFSLKAKPCFSSSFYFLYWKPIEMHFGDLLLLLDNTETAVRLLEAYKNKNNHNNKVDVKAKVNTSLFNMEKF